MSPETLKMAREALEIVSDGVRDWTMADYRRVCNAALRALDAATPAGPSSWMPIESAPKDGTAIWAVEPGEYTGMTIPRQYQTWWQKDHWADFGITQGLPTHWMPLPPAPTDKEARP